MISGLSKLDISHLKSGYHYFQGHHLEFDCEPIGEDNNYRYYQIYQKMDQTNRLLFYPVKVGHVNRAPTSLSLEQVLNFIQQNGLFSSLANFAQIIIPIGESTPIPLFQSYDHMVTLVIDLTSKDVDDFDKPWAKVKIIDSLSIGVPFCHQTASIKQLLQKYLTITHFEREYLSHQSVIDLSSCCYFTLKIIQYLLTHRIKSYQWSNLADLIPKPDTWFGTSYNWLTAEEKNKIQELILSVYEKLQPTPDEISQLQRNIIEWGST